MHPTGCLSQTTGSTDSCPAICDEYAAIAPQIRVFHRQNAGVSATRQFGIDQAKGEYLSFLDSDDYVDPQAYEKMYRSAKKEDADLVICDWYSVYGNVMYPESLKLKTWDKEHLLHALVLDQPAYQWAFLFRRSLFQNLSVGFPMERISFGAVPSTDNGLLEICQSEVARRRPGV